MDSFLDTLLVLIETLLLKLVAILDIILSPLEILGPEFVIFTIAFVVVLVSFFLNRIYTTKRHIELKEKFEYWYDLKQEALKQDNREKGKGVAKNIDQAKLNRLYYDYFFEGFLKGLVTTWLPVFLMLGYVTTIYSPQALLVRFGHEYLFADGVITLSSVKINSVFWYFISVIFSFIAVAGVKYKYKKKHKK